MTEFDYDDLQNEEELYCEVGIWNRTGKTVMLPSDFLDEASLQRYNGPCRTYRLGRPMTGTEFETMPQDLRRAYLRRLRQRGGSEADVEQMLGTAPGELRHYRVSFNRPDAAAWNRFVTMHEQED